MEAELRAIVVGAVHATDRAAFRESVRRIPQQGTLPVQQTNSTLLLREDRDR